MRIKKKHILLYLLIPLFYFSCKSQVKTLNEDTKEIVNTILKEYGSAFLINETYYKEQSFKPLNILNPYYRAYNSSNNTVAYQILYKDVKDIISLEELNKMKEKYKFWSIKKWKESDIKNNKIKLVSLSNMKNYSGSMPIIRISEPLFTCDKKKVIIYISYLKNKTGGQGIQIFVKENGEWKIKGTIPNGTSG